jgi:hypothetical protein
MGRSRKMSNDSTKWVGVLQQYLLDRFVDIKKKSSANTNQCKTSIRRILSMLG